MPGDPVALHAGFQFQIDPVLACGFNNYQNAWVMPPARCFIPVLLLALTASLQAQPAAAAPDSLSGARSFTYRNLGDAALRIHVFEPSGHRPQDRRPALVFFFGGAWTRGTPDRAAGWARLAASWGMVGVAPDYRTKDRFGTSPVEAVADARLAVRWLQENAAKLGVDPSRVVVGGNSAGAHLALWTAISPAPFGSAAAEDPLHRPVALILFSAPSNTDHPSLVRRFGPHIRDVSPLQRLNEVMPPVIMFHGQADTVVAHDQAVALDARLTATGNRSVFVSIPEGSHSFTSALPEWRERSRQMVRFFLEREGILPPP